MPATARRSHRSRLPNRRMVSLWEPSPTRRCRCDRRAEATEAVPDRLLARAHTGSRPGVLVRRHAELGDEPADRVQGIGVAFSGLGDPLESRTAEYAGWVRNVGTWVRPWSEPTLLGGRCGSAACSAITDMGQWQPDVLSEPDRLSIVTCVSAHLTRSPGQGPLPKTQACAPERPFRDTPGPRPLRALRERAGDRWRAARGLLLRRS